MPQDISASQDPHPLPSPTIVEWRVSSSEAGERLDRAVAAHVEELSRSYAATLVESGALTLNGSPATKPAQRIKAGDLLSLAIPPPQPSGLVAENIPLKVIYEDEDLLVIDKAAGMVVHPAPGHSGGTLVNALLAHVPEIELDMGDEARPGIVHRLDKDTSGLIVVAKRRAAHEALARQMSSRMMLKEYLAVVLGTLRPPSGVIDAPIARDPRDRQRMAIVTGGRPARTRYSTERELGRYTLVRATLETGRTHQIRVHMASTGHPILGDPVYGKRTLKDGAKLGLVRQFLHAHRLGFTIPSTGEWREFTSDLPEELQTALENLPSLTPA
ncbi:MAG TPA: RluA family pseudouridine synthase [Chloroflexia bacterium]|nr:RluA family pseudouridine synthase [Chloroflexia bacterium]